MSAREGTQGAAGQEPGAVLQFTRLPGDIGRAVELVTLLGDADAPSVQATPGGESLTTAPVAIPGLYGWRCGDAPPVCAPVNFPATESDLRTRDPGRVLAEVAAVVKTGRRVRQLRDGIDLWPWLLAAALLAAVIESVALWCMEGAR